jgi:hypothetical protein
MFDGSFCINRLSRYIVFFFSLKGEWVATGDSGPAGFPVYGCTSCVPDVGSKAAGSSFKTLLGERQLLGAQLQKLQATQSKSFTAYMYPYEMPDSK